MLKQKTDLIIKITIVLALLFSFLFLIKVSGVYAEPACVSHSVTFQWDRNTNDPEGSECVGYNLYQADNAEALAAENFDYGQSTSTKINPEGIPQLESGDTISYTAEEVPEGHWYWVVTAYDANGTESGPSNIVDKLVDYEAPNIPSNLSRRCVNIFIY